MKADERRQQAYFDLPRNQYPPAALLRPPLHTVLEIRRLLLALRGIDPAGGQIVDFGAGTGRLTLPLAGAGYRLLAVDISRASLDVLTTVAEACGLSSIETATELPDAVFPAVVGCDVLHHVDLEQYLPRLRALLRPGGRLIFSEPGALNPAWYPYLSLRHDFRVETGLVACNLATLRRSLRRAGFRDVRITGLGMLPRALFRFSARACRWNDHAGDLGVLRWFAYRYVICATA